MTSLNAVDIVSKFLDISVTGKSESVLRESLAAKINDLLLNDFNKLISILYRMDISESKLRMFLKENENADAGGLIASLMIEREAQKIISRRDHASKNENSDEEKW